MNNQEGQPKNKKSNGGGLSLQKCEIETSSNKELNRQLKMKGWLKDLQRRVKMAYAMKDYRKARFFLSEMLVIAKELGDKTVISNYKQNLRKINQLIKNI